MPETVNRLNTLPALNVVWSPVSNAWIVLWNNQVIRVISTATELEIFAMEMGV